MDVSVAVEVAPADVGAGVAVMPGVAVAEPAGVGDAEATLTGGLAVPSAEPEPLFRAE